MNEIKKRRAELNRQAKTADIEARCLQMEIGEVKEFKVVDLLAQQRLKMRLSRLKNEIGRDYITLLDGNNVIITRKS